MLKEKMERSMGTLAWRDKDCAQIDWIDDFSCANENLCLLEDLLLKMVIMYHSSYWKLEPLRLW
jgi:hypothetical protein